MDNDKKHGYWIHEKVQDDTSVSGFIYKRECTCSECGKKVNLEKPVCPYCGSIMNAEPKQKLQKSKSNEFVTI